MIIKTIRDIVSTDIDAIHIDEKEAFEKTREFLRMVMPHFVDKLQFYDAREPLFHKYRLEEEIAKINQRKVALPVAVRS